MALKIKIVWLLAFLLSILGLFCSCSSNKDIIRVTEVTGALEDGIGKEELETLKEIKAMHKEDTGLKSVIAKTPNYSVSEYLAIYPEHSGSVAFDYKIGPYDVIDIKIYEEPDLSRENVSVSGKGYISFPLIGRIFIEGLTTSETERLIHSKLVSGNMLINAHISVDVREYNSKKFMVLGAVKGAGTYPLQAKERVLDAISRSGGIDFEQGGKNAMIIRNIETNSTVEKKIVIRVDLTSLLKGGDQISNILLIDKDLFYVPKADFYYIIGQVDSPGKFSYQEKEITLLESISSAGGFTRLAARNKTRIIRVEDGVEKIIEVKVDKITRLGKKNLDIKILPNDVIVVPERFF